MKGGTVFLIDQTVLPFKFSIVRSKSHFETCTAIKNMTVRGAGAIGGAAAYAMAQAFLEAPEKGFWKYVDAAKARIAATRPTAQNLFFAIDRTYQAAKASKFPREAAVREAERLADRDSEACKKIGEYGSRLIKSGFNISTHCNAGWLAFVDYGSALAPIYRAKKQKKKIFVYVDETRPRGQGAKLTAWELKNEKVPFAIVPDAAGAHFMSRGLIDIVIVGADRIAVNGDTANKIGTLEKAIAAKRYGVPFYIAAPTSTFDLKCSSGRYIPIEERSQDEVLFQEGLTEKGKIEKILIAPKGSRAFNPSFDVTPAELITGIITERGIVKPSKAAILKALKV
jgi:S-methyl-5-thioribose-1-phosphate isomerase